MSKDNLDPKGVIKTHIKEGMMRLHSIGEGFNPYRLRWDDPPAAWLETLEPEIKEDPSIKSFKTVSDLAKSWVGAQKFLGREHLPAPKDENDKDAYSLIFKRLGLPENGDGYVQPTDLEIPKELPLDEEMLKDFRKTAHGLGILPKQFAGIYKWYMNSVIGEYNKASEARTTATQETETALRKDWGAAYQQNIALAKKVFSQFADEGAFKEFEKGAGNNPVYLRLFANIGKVLSEDQLTGKPTGLTMTPDEATLEINKIKSDMKHPYWNDTDPMHTQAVEHFNRLMKLVTG